MGPQPKRCHHCKSQDHLIADCPSRPDRNKKVVSVAGTTIPSLGATTLEQSGSLAEQTTGADPLPTPTTAG